MPQYSDFQWTQLADGSLNISLADPANVGGWTLRFQMQHRFDYSDNSGVFIKSCASGHGDGVSGITVTNSGAGQFQVAIRSVNTSGLDLGNYAYTFIRTDSGFRTTLAEGYVILTP